MEERTGQSREGEGEGERQERGVVAVVPLSESWDHHFFRVLLASFAIQTNGCRKYNDRLLSHAEMTSLGPKPFGYLLWRET